MRNLLWSIKANRSVNMIGNTIKTEARSSVNLNHAAVRAALAIVILTISISVALAQGTTTIKSDSSLSVSPLDSVKAGEAYFEMNPITRIQIEASAICNSSKESMQIIHLMETPARGCKLKVHAQANRRFLRLYDGVGYLNYNPHFIDRSYFLELSASEDPYGHQFLLKE